VVGHPESNELVALIVAVLALVCLLIPRLVYRQRPMPNGLVVALPVFLVIGIIAVYLGSDVRTLSRIAVGVAWLVGHVFFFSQLPTYREMTKMNLVKFAYIEKITILVPYTATAIITQYIFDAFNIYDSFASQVDLAIVYYMLMMVVIYCIALLRHLLLYFPKQQKPLPSPEQLEEAEVLRAICAKYALTKRESEVLAYLAKGYSRLYIEKKLFISKGTAKTHIFHIFQKLQVTSQDELIELVEQV
jgi:DNA-binding NarL/FixJ family response regulator